MMYLIYFYSVYAIDIAASGNQPAPELIPSSRDGKGRGETENIILYWSVLLLLSESLIS